MKRIAIFIFLIAIEIIAHAQKDGFSVNLGVAAPTDFGRTDDSDEAISMASGIVFGLRYQHALGTGRLHYFLDLDVRHHGITSDAQRSLDDAKEALDAAYGYDRSGATSSMTAPSYWFSPFQIGLRYHIPTSESFSLWGEAGTGIVYQIMSDQTYKGQYQNTSSGTVAGHHYTNTVRKSTTMTISSENAIHWALHLGVGVMLGKHFGFGLGYDWYYGKTTSTSETSTITEQIHNSDVGSNHTTDTDHNGPTKVTGDAASVPMFTLKLGYHF